MYNMVSPQDVDHLDDQHVFWEFQDPDRKKIIKRLIELDGSFRNLPRVNKLALWFAEIHILERAADPDQREWRDMFANSITDYPSGDHAGICEYTKEAISFLASPVDIVDST